MRILFADPDRALVRAYERLLKLDGHEILTAFDGIGALELVKTERIDLAILRERLPRYETEYIRKELAMRKTPVLLLTEEERQGEGEEILLFPFEPEELEKRIEEVKRHE